MNKRKSTVCFPCSRRAGLTLIEVVAAIAILGTILVGVVLAKSRHTHQMLRSQKQKLAVMAADDLIAGWWMSASGIPITQSGRIPGDLPLLWSTKVTSNPAIENLGARVLRVEIQDGSLTDDRSQEDPLLVAVELVLPDPARRPKEQR